MGPSPAARLLGAAGLLAWRLLANRGFGMNRVDDRWVRWLLVPAIVFISQATNDAYLVDFWHHLARGREMVATGRLLDHDIFTYTVAGRPFIDVNWLTQIVFYGLYSLGGLGLVRTVNALALAAAFGWLVGICKRESRSLEIAMSVGLLVFLGSWQVLTIRPQTLSIVLFVGLYDVLLRAEKDRRWLWMTPVFLAIWANVHGAFPAGIMLIGVFWGARVADAVLGGRGYTVASGSPLNGVLVWTLALIVAALATLINPYGFGVYEYARATAGIAAERQIDEWLPPSWDQGIGIAFFASLPIIIGAIAWSWRLSWREAFLLILFGYLAATSIRMVLWWLIAIAPMLASRFADFFPQSRSVVYAPSRAALFTVLGLLAFCVVSLPPLHAFNPILRVRGADETSANLEQTHQFLMSQADRGTVFAKLEWGEYLGWRNPPDWRVFMDGRIEIYPDEVWARYADTTRGKELPEADFLVIDAKFHDTTGLLPAVRQSPSWRQVAEFGNVVTFQRKS